MNTAVGYILFKKKEILAVKHESGLSKKCM